MEINAYQSKAEVTRIYPEQHKIIYPVLGLANEAGEVAGKLKKYLRRDYQRAQLHELLIDELGDVLWYVAATASDLGLTLEEIATRNLHKLAQRQQRGVLQGDGDQR